MDLCNHPYAILYIWSLFFYFVRYKILVSDLSLSGCLAVAWLFGIFQPQCLANWVAYKIKNVYKLHGVVSDTLCIRLNFSWNFFWFRQVELAQNSSKPGKNYQKAEIRSRCCQHHEESQKNPVHIRWETFKIHSGGI